jgi:TB2/DP1, HVA22 family
MAFLKVLYFLVLFVVHVVSLVVPGYFTYRALELQGRLDTWAQYWTVYGVFTFAEWILSVLVHRIPGWVLMKLVFFVWLQHPATQVLRPARGHTARSPALPAA